MADPIVTIKNGKLRGKIAQNYDGDEFYSFQGIPYAKPPVGPLRFKPPVPSESWEGIKDATKEGNECISYNIVFNITSGSEDCLFLNVYTKKLPDKEKLFKPVMVWIHGGAFIMGSGNSSLHGPEFFLTKDIVLVTINYRVGLLGFLNFEDPSLEIPGNMGLKDQVLALKWVNENIAHFNGDSSNVTVFGLSAGAASAHYLLLSPLAKGLFHKCIMQSGCVYSWWAKGHRSLPYLSKTLETSITSEKDAFNIVQNMPVEELINIQKKIPEKCAPSFKRCIGPVVEYKSENAFLTEEPDIIIKSGNYNHVPIIIGFTSREGMVYDFYMNEVKEHGHTIQNFESLIPYTISTSAKNECIKLMADKIRTFYYGNQKSSEENKNQFYLLHGDVGVVWPTYVTIEKHNSTSKSLIFLYEMSVDSTLSFVKKFFKIDTPGVAHSDDLSYFFNSTVTPKIIPNSVEDKIIKTCVTLWTNFAKYGNPNSPIKDSLINIHWKPTEKNNLHFLDIGENITVGINPEENRINFWKQLESCNQNCN
ncbi:hypothetical protein RN001_001344 [Aquatica leii]|uniref:Carboxylesterase type B domain-containing protein n=1 Tax=Aquatica leii TaxID=1421715 RepID=A0AAN7SQV8_9COLE|nr:hypothetical protein RN001_001344 [Aquatica leii]